MNLKLNKLLTFPANFTYKIIGMAHPYLVGKVIKVVQNYIPGDYSPILKYSSNGNYCSINITVIVSNFNQIEILYEEIGKIEFVRFVL